MPVPEEPAATRIRAVLAPLGAFDGHRTTRQRGAPGLFSTRCLVFETLPRRRHRLDAHGVARGVLVVLLVDGRPLRRQPDQDPPADRADELDALRRPVPVAPSDQPPAESPSHGHLGPRLGLLAYTVAGYTVRHRPR